VLTHPKHEKIIVPTKPKDGTGQWVYSLTSTKGGGTLIDLLLQQGWTWKQIKDLAIDYQPHSTPQRILPQDKFPAYKGPIIDDPQEQTILAQKQFASIRNNNRQNYLTKRGIHLATYKDFSGVKANLHKAIFALYQGVSKDPRMCSTITYFFERNGKSRKYFQRGLPRGLAVLQTPGEIKQIVITESPIDALSYKQIHSNKHSDKGIAACQTLYLACCGTLSQGIREELSEIFDHAKQHHQTVILSLDKDKAGKDMTNQLEALLQEHQCSYQVHVPPLGKDWNQALELTALKDQQRQLHEQKSELTRLEAIQLCQHIVIIHTPLEAFYLKQERLEQIKGLQEQIEHATDKEKPELEKQLLNKEQACNTTMYVSLPKELDQKTHQQLETLFENAQQQGQQVTLALHENEQNSHLAEEVTAILEEKSCPYNLEEAPLVEQREQPSLLEQIGFSKEVYQDNLQHMDIEQEQVSMALYQKIGQEQQVQVGTITYTMDEQGELQAQLQEQAKGLAVLEPSQPCQQIVITQTPLEALYLKQERFDQIQDLQEQLTQASEQKRPQLETQLLDKEHPYHTTMYVSCPGEINEHT
jgi:hypothetical protein